MGHTLRLRLDGFNYLGDCHVQASPWSKLDRSGPPSSMFRRTGKTPHADVSKRRGSGGIFHGLSTANLRDATTTLATW